MTDPASVAEMAQQAQARFGRIDGLVNNAAVFASLAPRSFLKITSEEFDLVMRVNVRGVFECVKAVTPFMRDQGYGKIVNIGSGTFFKGSSRMMHCVSSKGAIVGMTRAMARELGEMGVRVNCLAPGFVMSDGLSENPAYGADAGRSTVASRCIERPQTAEDLVGKLAYLLSADSDFMTGQMLLIDGVSAMN